MDKGTPAIAFSFLILLAGCASVPTIINSPDILQELEAVREKTLLDENGQSPIVRTDLDALAGMVAADQSASHYVEGMYWMVGNNEKDHLPHTLEFLESYLKNGEKTHCAPHELWHTSLYVEHQDWEKVEHSIEDASESYALWVADGREKQKEFPQFYLHFDEQAKEAAYAIEQLKQENYSDGLMQRIDALGDTAIC